MCDVQACRACLNQNCKLEPINDTTKRVYCAVSGLDFTPGDCYPSYFCTACITQIRKILAFRRQCRRAFSILKEIVAVRKKVTYTDLSIVDRKKTGLTSNIDLWRNNNTFFYSVNKVEVTDINPSDITETEPESKQDVKPYISVDTTKYKPESVNNSTFITVDIKPAGWEDDDDDDDEQKLHYQSGDDKENYDDMVGDEKAENVVEPDLEYVLEDLAEQQRGDDHDYSLSKLPDPDAEGSVFSGMQLGKAFMLSRILEDFTIKVLSFEEQTAAFVARKEAEPYKSASFKCAMCLIVYPDMGELFKHVQLHDKKQRRLTQQQRKHYTCAICKDSFASQAALTVHNACYHWYKYHCNKCNKDKYTLFDTLECHKRPPGSASKSYTLKELFIMRDMTSRARLVPTENHCRFCGWWSDKKRALRDHERSHSSGCYQCDLCRVWSKEKAHLESHMLTHYRSFTCKRCDQVFDGWNAANGHLKEHERLKCSNCEQTFVLDQERLEHEAKHSSDAKLDCNLCGLSVYGLSQIYYHQLANHGYININNPSVNDSNYRCGMCGEQFADEESLKAHKLEQGHVEADAYGGRCESCKKVFATVGELVAHRRGNTVCKRYPFKCTYCDEMLTNWYRAKRHYEEEHPTLPNEHMNALIYTVCELCGKNIVALNIKRHLKRHSEPLDAPLLACKLCDQKMFTSRAYVSHMLFNHTPKPYLCAQCPYRSKHRSECRDHILKVHKPELPYSCLKCGRRFSHLDLLSSHCRRMHGGISKEQRGMYQSLKTITGKVSVFPHMKIDGSLIPPAVIEDTDIYLYDYLCKSRKLVDWRDYYVFGTGVEPTPTDPAFHKRPLQKKPPIKSRVRWKGFRKPVNETIIKAVENQNFDLQGSLEVNEKLAKRFQNVKRKNIILPDVMETSDQYDVNADVDNVEHEEILGNDIPNLGAAVLGETSEVDSYVDIKKPQKRPRKKRDTGRKKQKKKNKATESKIASIETVKVVDLEDMSDNYYTVDPDDVEHEEMVQGHDMPDLQAEVLEDPPEVIEDEILVMKNESNGQKTVEGENEELDMTQLLNENYQVIEESGEQYVVVNGNLYKLQVG